MDQGFTKDLLSELRKRNVVIQESRTS